MATQALTGVFMLHERNIRPAGRVVSATFFVRNFADLKREADRAPIYIESHGKAGWALLSNAQLEAMSATEPDHGFDAKAVLLDMANALAVLIAADGVIAWANAPMLRHLAVSSISDWTIGALADALAAPYLASAARRVAATGQAEAFELDLPTLPGRIFRVTLTRAGGHVALLAEDVTEAAAEQQHAAIADGLEHAIDTLAGLARGTVNLRGAIDTVRPSLSALTGTSDQALLGARLPSLFAVSSRVAVGDAVERALKLAAPQMVSAELLVAGATLRAVQLSVAALSHRGRVSGAAFLIQATA